MSVLVDFSKRTLFQIISADQVHFYIMISYIIRIAWHVLYEFEPFLHFSPLDKELRELSCSLL